ncbi:MAG: DUF6438 domain-containing protein [Saprospiraceae bacterium]|nr:DUF6438 domain-containing protein [Saprospiraceae bacterium]MDW8485078.1 DUF6438 domain-containing protein [Saprospiraceae bacterium]
MRNAPCTYFTTLRPFLLHILLGVLACRPVIDPVGKDLLVELQTGGCFGYCPVIRLSVYTNGRMEYEGKQFAERQGKASFQLTYEEMRQLRRQLKKASVCKYPERIASEVVDAPWSTLTTTCRGQTKSVTGSIDRPRPLLDLENLLRNLAEVRGYQTRRGVPPSTDD